MRRTNVYNILNNIQSQFAKDKKRRIFNFEDIRDCNDRSDPQHILENGPDQYFQYTQVKCSFGLYQVAPIMFPFGGRRANNRLEIIYENDIPICEILGFEDFCEHKSTVSSEDDVDGDEMMDVTTTKSSASTGSTIKNFNTSQQSCSEDQIVLNEQTIKINEQKIRIMELENESKRLDLEQQRLSFSKKSLNRRCHKF